MLLNDVQCCSVFQPIQIILFIQVFVFPVYPLVAHYISLYYDTTISGTHLSFVFWGKVFSNQNKSHSPVPGTSVMS